jgi:hypothetical protein
LLASENKWIGSQATWASVLHSHWKQADHFVASKTTGGRECNPLESAFSVLRMTKTALG